MSIFYAHKLIQNQSHVETKKGKQWTEEIVSLFSLVLNLYSACRDRSSYHVV